MKVDSHTHIGPGPDERSAEALLAMLDEYDIQSAIAFPGPGGLAGSPRQIARANEYVAAAAAAHPSRIIGFGTINPWHAEEAWLELEQLRRRGLKGLKLHPPIQGFVVSDRGLLDPVMQRAAEYALPVVIHAGLRVAGLPYVLVNLEDVHALALAHPTVSLVVAHAGWGGRDARGIDDLIRDCPNVWFDTAGINMPAQIDHLVQAGAGRRVMYGSDFPFLHPRVERLRVELANLSDEVQARVLGDNVASLLGSELP